MANVTLRCADERLNDIVSKKFADNLTLAELGGIKWHLSRDSMEELFEQVEFAVDHKGTKAISLISHTDCGLYKELGEDEAEQYTDDLHSAIQELHERFPDLSVNGYIYNVESKQLTKVE